MRELYGAVPAPAEGVAEAETVVVAVKPQSFPAAYPAYAPYVKPGTLVVSIMAGIPTAAVEAAFPGARVVRVMPNLALAVGCGASGVAPGKSATEEDVRARDRHILRRRRGRGGGRGADRRRRRPLRQRRGVRILHGRKPARRRHRGRHRPGDGRHARKADAHRRGAPARARGRAARGAAPPDNQQKGHDRGRDQRPGRARLRRGGPRLLRGEQAPEQGAGAEADQRIY